MQTTTNPLSLLWRVREMLFRYNVNHATFVLYPLFRGCLVFFLQSGNVNLIPIRKLKQIQRKFERKKLDLDFRQRISSLIVVSFGVPSQTLLSEMLSLTPRITPFVKFSTNFAHTVWMMVLIKICVLETLILSTDRYVSYKLFSLSHERQFHQ